MVMRRVLAILILPCMIVPVPIWGDCAFAVWRMLWDEPKPEKQILMLGHDKNS